MPERKTILIIDDEIDLCLLLKEYFVRKGYQVTVRHTLKEGIAALYSTPPSILFLDNNLPDGTGWTEATRFAIDIPDTFIVLISAFHPSILDVPADNKFGRIEKPISLADLDKQFEDLLAKRHA